MAKTGLTYREFSSRLSRKEISPVYLLHGAEDFLAEEATTSIIEVALLQEERSFNLDIMYGPDTEAREVISRASSFPMMAERRVVILRDMDRLSNKELLTSYLEHPSPTTCLVLLSPKPDFRKKPYTTARNAAVVVECKPLYENQVPEWVLERVTQQNKGISPEAAKMLASYAATSLREVQSEIDKLLVYVGEKKQITVDDITAVVGVSKEFNVFELQNALGQRDMHRSTFILGRMMDGGESPAMIIVMLTRFYVTLWKLADLDRRGVPRQEHASQAGINPYFLKEYARALNNYTLDEIQETFSLLSWVDEQLKTTSADPRVMMQMLIVSLVGEGKAAFSASE